MKKVFIKGATSSLVFTSKGKEKMRVDKTREREREGGRRRG